MMGQRSRGFTLLELIVVICIVAVLTGSLLSRIKMHQKQAELAQMDTVVGVLRSALGMKVAQLVLQGERNEVFNLITINPMDLLAQKPANYAGELIPPQTAKISPGNWYFNRKKLLLVYIPSIGATFQTADPSPFVYRLELVREMDGEIGARSGTSEGKIEGVVLNRVSQTAQ